MSANKVYYPLRVADWTTKNARELPGNKALLLSVEKGAVIYAPMHCVVELVSGTLIPGISQVVMRANNGDLISILGIATKYIKVKQGETLKPGARLGYCAGMFGVIVQLADKSYVRPSDYLQSWRAIFPGVLTPYEGWAAAAGLVGVLAGVSLLDDKNNKQ